MIVVAYCRQGRAREVICPVSHREEEEMGVEFENGFSVLSPGLFPLCLIPGRKEDGGTGERRKDTSCVSTVFTLPT